MTLREESGNAPPTGSETGGQPQELPAQQQELPGQQQEPSGQPPAPAAQSQESPAHLREAAPPVPPPRTEPSPLEVPASRETPPQLEVPAPREAPHRWRYPHRGKRPHRWRHPHRGKRPPPLEAVAPPLEAAAAPRTPGGHAAPAEPGPGTGPASPGAGPPRRRRSLAAILVGGFAAVCLIGLGAFATVLLLHGRPHARLPALPSVFRLRVGDCVNSGPDGISSPTVVPCGQPHDAEVYAEVRAGRAQLAGGRGHRRPGTPGLHGQARQLSQPAAGHHRPSGIVRFSRPRCVERRRTGGYLRNP